MSTTGRLRGPTKKALERIKKLTEKYEAAGMSKAAAKERAKREARDNPKADFRRFAKKTKA